MNAITALMLIVAGQDADAVPDNFAKYFTYADNSKLRLVEKQERYLDVATLQASSMKGDRLAIQTRKIATLKKELKQARELIPHAFFDSRPVKGEIGMFEEATTLAVLDGKSVLAKVNASTIAVLTVDNSTRLKSMRNTFPDYVFCITADGETTDVSSVTNDDHRKAISLSFKNGGRYAIAEYVKKADLVKYRNAWEASKKDAAK